MQGGHAPTADQLDTLTTTLPTAAATCPVPLAADYAQPAGSPTTSNQPPVTEATVIQPAAEAAVPETHDSASPSPSESAPQICGASAAHEAAESVHELQLQHEGQRNKDAAQQVKPYACFCQSTLLCSLRVGL